MIKKKIKKVKTDSLWMSSEIGRNEVLLEVILNEQQEEE